jgi:L-histidine N-alpha-methyltransferase
MPAFGASKTESQRIAASESLNEFRRDVRRGLSQSGQKELSPQYFYDDLGSALFDAITVLPEYGLTRADTRLLRQNAGEIARRLEGVSLVIELGSGSGSKARWLLSQLASGIPVTFCPIDVSEAALHRCWLDLGQMDSVGVVPFAASFLEGLQQAVRLRDTDKPLAVLFLGSTIGNFDPDDAETFLSEIRQALRSGDFLVLSTDLEKDIRRLIAAYDDSIGVTAAFNLNLLSRINRELQGNFVLPQFRHEARYNEQKRRIEMHVRSLADQRVSIGPDFSVDLRRGETIRTECSYKFRREDVLSLAERTGFTCQAQWIDREWPFAQSLLQAK